MARKKRQVDLRGVDPASPEYWEEVLGRKGLSMEAGTSRRVTYVGDSSVLESIEAAESTGNNDSSRAKDVTYREPI